MSKNGTFLFERSSFIPEILEFLLAGSSKNINHKIDNISANISVMPFKLGTSNVRQVRSKVIPTVMLLWQHSRFQAFFAMNQISPFLNRRGVTDGLT